MNAACWSIVPRVSRCILRHGRLPVPGMLALLLVVTWGRAAAQEPVTAVWKERQLHFAYRVSAADQSCSLLHDRITRVLNAVGARPDLQVSVSNCDLPLTPAAVPADVGGTRPPTLPESMPGSEGAGLSRSSSQQGTGYLRRAAPRQVVNVYVRMSMPVEMTPEVIAELKTDRKRRELLAQVTGDPLPLFDDPIPFAAQRQRVTLSRQTIGMEAADCELLDQMVAGALRTLGVSVVQRGHACDRESALHIAPTLVVEALVPLQPG